MVRRLREKMPAWLTDWDVKTLRTQIRRNSRVIDTLIQRIDLLINRERCPQDANTLLRFRKRLDVAMAENDTFRKALARHLKLAEQRMSGRGAVLDPILFLVGRIKSRERTCAVPTGTKT